ncbi:hypothetical protein ACS0TY_015590 [Phlomoides rotata]
MTLKGKKGSDTPHTIWRVKQICGGNGLAAYITRKYTDFDAALSHIRQTELLRDYQKEFECITSLLSCVADFVRVQDWPKKALVGAFIGGLKFGLAAEVRVYHPRSYLEGNWPDFKMMGSWPTEGLGTGVWSGQLGPVDRPNSSGIRRLLRKEMQR